MSIPHALHAFTLLSAQEFMMILEKKTLKSEFLMIILSYVVQLEKHREPMRIFTHELLIQQQEIQHVRTTPISASGVLI